MVAVTLLLPLDYAVIAVYLVGIIVMGSLFAKGQKTSDDYFVAGRQMHWFPLALSIWASLTSANSMLGAPGYGNAEDLQYMPMVFTGLAAAVIVIYLILPLLHRLNLTTAYTYLEKRYGVGVRCLGSFLFILLRGSWLASVIYAPSKALAAVVPIEALSRLDYVAGYFGTDGNTLFWILVVGLGATLYTTLGGLKAVIWTDVVQFFVFVLGMGAIWFLLMSELPDGLGTIWNELGNVPKAQAGRDREAAFGQTVQLDGSQSVDFQGGPLVYHWRQVSGPPVQLSDPEAVKPHFQAPARPADGSPCFLRFSLRVSTTGRMPLESSASVVNIAVKDHPAPPPTRAAPRPDRPHDTWFDFRLDFFHVVGLNFWLLLGASFMGRINDAGADQVALQRYFSARSLKFSQQSIWLNAVCDIPLMPLLYLTGAGILMFYAIHPTPELPPDPDKAMPFFVAHKLNELVPGLSGLFMAALFSATMSSVDSGINSLSAATATDWYRRLWRPAETEEHYLNVSRLMTLGWGLLATFAAMWLGKIGQIWEIAVGLMGFWTGPLVGIFLLGFFTTRTNAWGALLGAIAGLVCVAAWAWAGGDSFFYSTVGTVPTLIVGYAASWLAPRPRPEQVDGLTNWTRSKRETRE